MQRLSREKYTTVLDPTLPPAITVASGEELVVETWDAYMGVWGAHEQPTVLGPATGPIAVHGALPGDALKVEILAITPGPSAMHDVRAGRGAGGGIHHPPTHRDADSGRTATVPGWTYRAGQMS